MYPDAYYIPSPADAMPSAMPGYGLPVYYPPAYPYVPYPYMPYPCLQGEMPCQDPQPREEDEKTGPKAKIPPPPDFSGYGQM